MAKPENETKKSKEGNSFDLNTHRHKNIQGKGTTISEEHK
jgi:hypothetical protein